jgi:hypothetical protein
MSEEYQDNNQHRRKTDDSVAVWFKDKVVAPLIVAFIIGSSAGGWALYKKLDDLGLQMQQQYTQQQGHELELRIAAIEREQAVIKANMVSLDLLKKIELAMSVLASSGQTNKSIDVIVGTIRSEIQSRKEIQEYNKGNK